MDGHIGFVLKQVIPNYKKISESSALASVLALTGLIMQPKSLVPCTEQIHAYLVYTTHSEHSTLVEPGTLKQHTRTLKQHTRSTPNNLDT